MTDVQTGLRGSAETWRSTPVSPPVPEALLPPRSGSPAARLRAWRQRHLLRARRAEEFFAASRAPERGLPVADRRDVGAFASRLLGTRRFMITVLLVLHALAALAGLIVPRILGSLVDKVSAPGTLASTLDGLALAVAGVVVVQAIMIFFALRMSVIFGQDLLAEAREYVVRTVLGLPLSKVESASTGDLVTRVTRDVSTMSMSIRFGLPETVIAGMTTLLTVVAMLLNSPYLTLPLLVSAPLLIIGARRYVKRAPKGYITEGGTYSQINSTFTETVEGGRTVEALGLQQDRIERGDSDLAVSGQAERYTMSLRNLLFTVIGFAYDMPLVMVLILGAIGYAQDWVSLGQITTATLYVQALVEPLDRLIRNVDRLQVGIASTCRLLGIAAVPQDREPGDRLPVGNHLVGRNLRFAYYDSEDVLHGIDLAPRPGERLAIVGPSGSGKSTLGRLLAGINKPRTGSVTMGEVELTELPLPALRTQVALVTQEHHVFVGTLRDNIILAREASPDDVVIEALQTVEAWDWVQRLPLRLDTMVGSGQQNLTPAQAQQIALARLVVADPHTLVLDEATSLIDPRTARHLEGSMAALLQDRTVVAIAHRLHTAHDADRIAVVIDGRIAELGSHHELVAANGEYARLWRAWTS
jgi:ABC-type multidrug transport system fused ATPase/permease subunit